MTYPVCDGCGSRDQELRFYPVSLGSKERMELCRSCFDEELAYNHERRLEGYTVDDYPTVEWDAAGIVPASAIPEPDIQRPQTRLEQLLGREWLEREEEDPLDAAALR
jgi:hypothetical protein